MTRFLNNDELLGKVHFYSGIHFYRVRVVSQTKKDHICLSCEKTIPAGGSSTYHSGLDNGTFYYYHQCLTCNPTPIQCN